MKNYKIVIVDQKRIMKKLRGLLELEGFQISTYSSCIKAPASTPSNGELVRFDILLSGESVASTFLKIHSFSSTPSFIIAARIDNTDQLTLLEKGIRDSIDRLVDPAGVRNHFKAELNLKNLSLEDEKLSAGPISINLKNNIVSVFESEIHLTPTEFNLLRFLVSNHERVCTRHELTTVLYGHGAKDRNRILDCHIARIRKKISQHLPGQNVIRSAYGTGYFFRIPREG